jgi:hypothetical protein
MHTLDFLAHALAFMAPALSFIGRYGMLVSIVICTGLALAVVATMCAKRSFPQLRTQIGAVLGVENNMAAIALSSIAFGAFVAGVDGMASSVMEWACKAVETYIAQEGDHYWADHFNYPGNGAQVAVTAANFVDPVTNEQKYLSFTPRCFTNLAGTYEFTGTTNGGIRNLIVDENGNHDPATLIGIGGTGTQTKNQFNRAAGGQIAI